MQGIQPIGREQRPKSFAINIAPDDEEEVRESVLVEGYQGKNLETAKKLIEEADIWEQECAAAYGLLDDAHPVSEYLNQRIQQLFPDAGIKVKLLLDHDQANAFALTNRTIFVTKKMLEFVDSAGELDFILAHEARHIVKQHILARQLQAAKFREETGSSVGAVIDTLGVARINETDADIGGVLAMAQEDINPVAARAYFQKLYEIRHEKLKKEGHHRRRTRARSTAHSTEIDRLVNLGIATQLRDFTATSKELVSFPEDVAAFIGTDTAPRLTKKVNDFLAGKTNIENIYALLSRASLHEQVLLIQKIRAHPRFISARDKYTVSGARHSVDQLEKVFYSAIKQRVSSTFPELAKTEHCFIMHAVLEIGAGVRTDEALGTVIEKNMQSLLEIEDLDELKEKLTLLTPERFKKLALPISFASNVSRYLTQVLRSANENGLFDDVIGFNQGKYVEFIQWCNEQLGTLLTNRVASIDGDHGAVEEIITEGMLGLDLRASNQPAVKYIAALKASGLKIHPVQVMDIIFEQKHFNPEDKESIEQIRVLLVEGKPALLFYEDFCQIIRKKEAEVKKRREAEEKRKAEKKWGLPKTAQKIEKVVHDVKDDLTIREERRAAEEALFKRLFEEVEFRSLQEVKDFLEQIDEEQFASNDSSNLTDFILNIIRHFMEEGADFLPASRPERCKLFVALLRSAPRRAYNMAVAEFLRYDAEPVEWTEGFPVDELLEYSKEVNQLVNGTHPHFEAQSWQGLALERGSQLFSDCVNKIYLNFSQWLEHTDTVITKERLLKELEEIFEFIYSQTDAAPQAEGGNTLDVLDAIFKRFEFNLDDPLDQEILLYCSGIIKDPMLKARFQEVLINKYCANMEHPEKARVLFQDPRLRASMVKDNREVFIEEETQTHAELRTVNTVLEQEFTRLTGSEKVGALVLMEQLADIYPSKRRMFKHLMSVGKSDYTIKRALFNHHRDSFHEDDLADELIALRAEASLDKLLNLNEVSRYFLVRNLLIGEDGLLIRDEDRRWLFHLLQEDYLEPPGEEASESKHQLHNITREVLDELRKSASPDELFFMLSPFILDNILRQPEKIASWEDILVRTLYDEDIAASTSADIQRLKEGGKVKVHRGGTDGRMFEEEIEAREAVLIRPHIIEIDRLIENEEKREARPNKKWEIEAFLIKIAESLGSPGVRFLQIIGQYAELPPELEEAFMDVYDNVRGQSKLTATDTMRREWPTFETEVSRVLERIGGGSLMSVYLCEMHDGSQQVLKVLNPNARMQMKETIKVIRRTFSRLAKESPKRYGVANAALSEIEAWITQDINYKAYIERDARFRDRYHGKSMPGHNYSLYIPKSSVINPEAVEQTGGDTIYVKREEYVPGKTLARAFKTMPEAERKDVAALIVKNYFMQLMDGQVHSDIHPGNFIIADNQEGQKQLAIIDRNNYVELTMADKMFFTRLQGVAQSPKNLMDTICEHFNKFEAANIPRRTIDRLAQRAERFFSDEPDYSALVPRAMLLLKEEKVKIPLKLTLMVKNMNGLNHIMRLAGFSSLTEAFKYQPEH